MRNRPYALLQGVLAANITEDYIMMSEPDHIFLRPLPNFMRSDDEPAAFVRTRARAPPPALHVCVIFLCVRSNNCPRHVLLLLPLLSSPTNANLSLYLSLLLPLCSAASASAILLH